MSISEWSGTGEALLWEIWVQISALPLASAVSSGKSFELWVPVCKMDCDSRRCWGIMQCCLDRAWRVVDVQLTALGSKDRTVQPLRSAHT